MPRALFRESPLLPLPVPCLMCELLEGHPPLPPATDLAGTGRTELVASLESTIGSSKAVITALRVAKAMRVRSDHF